MRFAPNLALVVVGGDLAKALPNSQPAAKAPGSPARSHKGPGLAILVPIALPSLRKPARRVMQRLRNVTSDAGFTDPPRENCIGRGLVPVPSLWHPYAEGSPGEAEDKLPIRPVPSAQPTLVWLPVL